MTWSRLRVVEQPGELRPDHEGDSDPDDEALATAAQRDPAMFDALYSRYVGPIYRYCHVRLGSREAAEDATSATFLKAISALPGYRAGNFAGWLYRIAANTVLDIQRERGRRRPPVLLDDVAEPRDVAPLPEEQAINRDRQAELRAAFASLPEDPRATVELKLAGWDGRQIADALGRSPEAVRMLRHRALTRLRVILTDPADPQPPGGQS